MVEILEKNIMSSWSSKDIVVSICCLTFNHEKYIEECIDSLLNQKTKFAFEILIHDDASTDNTVEILKNYESKYPHIVRIIYQNTNQRSLVKNGMNLRFNFNRAKGKYLAICDGDDYWSDNLKMQKQVDFLESNLDYGFVHTNCHEFYQESNQFNLNCNHKSQPIIEPFLGLLNGNLKIKTLTVMVKKSLIDKDLKDILDKNKFGYGDLAMWLYFSNKTKFHYMVESTSINRKYIGSVTNPVDKKQVYRNKESGYRIKLFFANEFKAPVSFKKKLYISYFQLLFDRAYYNKDKILAHKLYQRNLIGKNFKNRAKFFLIYILEKFALYPKSDV